ncbi:hypothetical protein C5L14_16430 [Labrys okinawensis]|uniref:Uncharacterized protein n=1 Tax=Labrys okinawensis TaxID=346911 RepID=A0A2S9QC06_9HYPH|nr:hypothetical protein [Labrys okinawensis]PRH86874.1 hypothetical protein C5L14_16430 [Labrys okinawensis]
MAEPLKKDEALAAAVREAFQRHMENARLAAEALKEKQAAAAAQRGVSPPARDPRLIVPKPANEAGPAEAKAIAEPAEAKLPEAKPAESSQSDVKASSPSLDRLVALASPPTEAAPRPAEVPPAEAEAKPVQAPEPSSPFAAPQADLAPVVEDNADDSGFDFGEALFIEIAPEAEKKAQAEPPKMPRAASLDTPAPERPASETDEIFEFRGPPSRERPRMSTVSATAGPPQDLDQRSGSSSAMAHAEASATPAAPTVQDERSAPPRPAPARKTTRFGVNPAANANETRFFRRSLARIKVPPALIASVLLAAGIAAVGAYFWANPEKLQSLGSMIAPPASTSPETKVAAAPPPAPPPAAAPAQSVAPPPPASAAAPASPDATRSVSTIAITVDEVDQAVQTARELLAGGDVIGAREALESYRSGSDPRALFALAETYDPAIVKDPSQANAAQAKAFYEAAAKAGSQDSAERLARLALVHAN